MNYINLLNSYKSFEFVDYIDKEHENVMKEEGSKPEED